MTQISEREKRLESLVMRALNGSPSDKELMQDVQRDLPQFRKGHNGDDLLPFKMEKSILFVDEDLILTGSIGDRKAIFMRIPEETFGYDFLAISVSDARMARILSEPTCLRSETLHLESETFVIDALDARFAKRYRAPLHEGMLCDAGFSIKDFLIDEDVSVSI